MTKIKLLAMAALMAVSAEDEDILAVYDILSEKKVIR